MVETSATDDDVQIITPREREVSKNLKPLEEKVAKLRKYRMWTLEEKIELGTYASKYTAAKTVRDFLRKYSGLRKQSVSDFKKGELKPPKLKKQGRLFLLPEDIMKKKIDLVRCLRLRGALISTAVITSVARDIVEALLRGKIGATCSQREENTKYWDIFSHKIWIAFTDADNLQRKTNRWHPQNVEFPEC